VNVLCLNQFLYERTLYERTLLKLPNFGIELIITAKENDMQSIAVDRLKPI